MQKIAATHEVVPDREGVIRALETDLILTAGQLWHYHRVSPVEARTMGLYTFSDVISPTGKSYAFQPVRVFTHLKRVVRKRPLGLKILLGLAEMRHRLGVPPHTWELFMKRKLEPGANPRALYRPISDTEQLVAVVYDTGKWVLSDQARRATVLGGRYSAQVWGTPSLARQKSLESMFRQLGEPANSQVVWAPYAPELSDPRRFAYPADGEHNP
jgi:hypothetical protein